MLSNEKGELKAKVLPYGNFKERMLISRLEERAGRKIAWDKKNVYSFSRDPRSRRSGANKNFVNLRCVSCNNVFRIIALHDVQWAMCPRCGGANIDKPSYREELHFESRIK